MQAITIMGGTVMAVAGFLLSACDLAPPPDQQSAAAQKAAEHHELNDAIQKPLDKAKSANDPNVQADKDREKAIEDAGG